MRIAIASGKGGTGKTSVSTAIAEAVKGSCYFDCDVEEPNGFLILKPENIKCENIYIKIPKIEPDKCTNCRKCYDICRFNAIYFAGDKANIFEELCHSCGGCNLVCPTGAIQEYDKKIGELKTGSKNDSIFTEGKLDIGFSLAPTVIRTVKKNIDDCRVNIIDCPPGTACTLVSAIQGSDFVILTTEPTPFGLHDLKLAIDVVKDLNLPFGVIINKSDIGDDKVEEFCMNNNYEILMKIPFSMEIAKSYSRGENIINADYSLKDKFVNLANDLLSRKVR
ncbi:MAG: ATP-binding protein [Candidatus Delongbacteria bacterium]|nr:ATP-binding protein [Candidatus Delongbacteria bacterium]MBN2835109.1 ATP-binding protein [Candidatus Delongbacteria bacterium]